MKLLSIILLTITFLLISTKCSDDVEVVYIKPDSVDVITHYIYETPADTSEVEIPDTTNSEIPNDSLAFVVSVDTTTKIDVQVDIDKMDIPYEKNGKLYPYWIHGKIIKQKTENEYMSNDEVRHNIIEEEILFTRNSYAACSGSARRAKENLELVLKKAAIPLMLPYQENIK